MDGKSVIRRTWRPLAAVVLAVGIGLPVRAAFLDATGTRATWLTLWPLLAIFLAIGVLVWSIADAVRRARERDTIGRAALLERESGLRGFLDAIPHPVVLKDRESRWQLANRAALAVVGRSAEEVIGKTDGEFLGDEAAAAILRRNDARTMASGVTEVIEESVPTPDGPRVYQSTKVPYRDTEGRIVGLISSAVDVTERKRTEEVLAFLSQSIQSGGGERFFQDLAGFLARLLDMHFVCIDRLEGDGLTAQTLAVWCDGAFQDNVSYALKDTPCGDVVGKKVCCFPASVCQYFPRDVVLQDLRAESYVGVTLWSHSGAPIGLIAVIGRSPLADPGVAARVLEMVSSRASNELERLETERALRESEGHFRKLFEQHAACKLTIDPGSGRIVDANQAAASFYGWTREQLRQMRIQDINVLSAEEVEREMAAAAAARRERFEFRHRRADGSVRDVDVYSSRIDVEGRPLLHSIVHDNSARKRAERELAESEQRYRLVVTTMADGLILQGPDGVPTACNPAAERILGLALEEMRARRAREPFGEAVREDRTRFPAGDQPPAMAFRTGRRQPGVVMGIRGPAGGLTWIRVNSEPVLGPAGGVDMVVSTFTDITAEKEAEAEHAAIQAKLMNASRLAALGTLVAGLAHEINNPLAAEIAGESIALEINREVRNRLEAGARVDAETELRALDQMAEALADAQEGGQRIARIVKDMAAFARPDAGRARVRLREVVNEALRWVPASLLQASRVEVVDQGSPEILASAGQMQQVVVNLLTNAIKARSAGTAGTVVLRIGAGSAGQAFLEVTDDGSGIDPAIRDRIFDPFFTTRPVGEGRGTGLGLAVSHAIATSHGGTLTVESEVGKGSTFRVELPAAPVEA